jgi:hypothetical protein
MGIFDFLKSRRSKADQAQPAQDVMPNLAFGPFPDVAMPTEAEAEELQALLRGRLEKEQVRALLLRTRIRLALSPSDDQIVRGIVTATDGKLTAEDARLVYRFVTGISGPLYAGGDGLSRAAAVVIQAPSNIAGVRAEYDWLEAQFGERDEAWTLRSQHVAQDKRGFYDVFVIELSDGTERTIYFDIGAFFGRP